VSFIPHIGVQLDICYLLPAWNSSVFVPTSDFRGIYINEGIAFFSIRSYLVLSTASNDEYALVFKVCISAMSSKQKHLRPTQKQLLQVYRAARIFE
jgi:GPI-GlcNAc transferase complex, PIG-H component